MMNTNLPDKWKIVHIDEICSINKDTLSEKNADFQFKYIDLSSVKSGKILCSAPISFKGSPSRARRIIRKNDIIMSTVRPNLQGFAHIDFDAQEYICSTGFAVLTVKPNISSKFIYYCLYSKSVETQINNMLVGSNYPAINSSDVASLRIFLPPLAEQEKIAEILSCWDEGIEKLSALIEKKKIQKKALMQKLLNFQRDYLKRFDEIFEDYSDKRHPDKDLLSATQENGVIPRRLLKGRVMSPEGGLDGYKLVQPGNFVISLRSFQGGFEYSNYEGIISPAYTVLKNKIEINRYFYKYFFKSYNFIEKYLSIAVIGIRDGKQISYPDLQSVKIPCPPLPEQKAIAEILSKADEEIELLNKKLEAFKLEKKALMQKLLTGKIRVKVV